MTGRDAWLFAAIVLALCVAVLVIGPGCRHAPPAYGPGPDTLGSWDVTRWEPPRAPGACPAPTVTVVEVPLEEPMISEDAEGVHAHRLAPFLPIRPALSPMDSSTPVAASTALAVPPVALAPLVTPKRKPVQVSAIATWGIPACFVFVYGAAWIAAYRSHKRRRR